MTNEEKVKQMSTEELAQFIIYDAKKIYRDYTSSYAGLIKWLKEGVKEND